MSNYDLPLHVSEYVDPILRMMSEDQSMGISADIDLVSEEMKTNDMVRLIKERLEQFKAEKEFKSVKSTGSSGKDTPHDPRGYVLQEGDSSPYRSAPYEAARPRHMSDWGVYEPTGTRGRAYSGGVPSRVVDDDITRGWAPVDEGSDYYPWAPPQQQPRRATYDESDFNQYRQRGVRPAWKCKPCGGVAWSEEDPCEGCGRFLPPNLPIGNSSMQRGAPPMRPGDWICSSCSNTNWEWRTQCNRCHTCREVPEGGRSVKSGDGSPVSEVDELVKQRLKKRLSTHPAGVFKDNDWVCVTCGNINWDWRSKCHQCSTAKPVARNRGPISTPSATSSGVSSSRMTPHNSS